MAGIKTGSGVQTLLTVAGIKQGLGSRDFNACVLAHNLTDTPSPDDTVGDLKKLIAAQTGTKADKIVLKKW